MKKPFRLSRRALLRGKGAAIALPLLEAMLPGTQSAFAQSSRPVRMIAYFVPNGIHMQSWTPSSEGQNFTLTPTLQPLAAVKDYLLVLSNLHNNEGRPIGNGDHASGTGSFLSCYQVRKDLGDNIENRTTVDQVAAQQIGHLTPLPSLELGMFGGDSAGNCDNGYGCAYSRNISWSGPKTPVPKLTEPQQVFDRLFANYDAQGQDSAIRRALNKSLLDYVVNDINRLEQKLGYNDRAKVDEYLSSIRQIEQQMNFDSSNLAACSKPARPASSVGFQEKAKLMADLMVLAFQCDLTRISTFMMGNASAKTTYEFLGISGAHHDISHHGGLQSNYDKLKKIDLWEVEQFAYLLNRLKNTVEPDGVNLLETSQAFFSSDVSDGNTHNHDNMPVLLAGRANGYFNTGRHIRYPSAPSWANLFVSMLEAMGTPVQQIGDSSGTLAGLTG